MKNIPSIQKNISLLLIVLLLSALKVIAQSTEEKQSVSMSIKYEVINGIKKVKVNVDTKVDGKRISVKNLIVNLYLNEIKKYDTLTALGWMGNVVTNEDGIAEFTFTKTFNSRTKDLKEFHFLATSNSDLRYEDAEAETIISDVQINLSINNLDSTKSATIKLSKMIDGVQTPLAETEIKLFVDRTFGEFPFAEEGAMTDENGEYTAEIPSDIIGTSDGKLTIIARFEDPENDGKLEVSQTIPWTILPYANKAIERTLWSPGNNAPIPLVVASVSIITVIWGLIIYLISLLFKLKKAGNV